MDTSKAKLQLIALASAVEMASEAAATKAAEAAAEAAAYTPHKATRPYDSDDWLWECESRSHKEGLVNMANLAQEHSADLANLAKLAKSALENISRADVFTDNWWIWHRS